MPSPYWTVETSGATQLQNISAVTMTTGRRVLTDNYSAGRASVSGRRPDLLPTLNIGDVMTCKLINPNTSPTSTFTTMMRISDLQIVYGQISALDTWTLTLEDTFAIVGRDKITRTWAAGTSTLTAFQDVCTDAGVTQNSVIAMTTKTMSATTVTAASALETLQTILNTEQGLLYATMYTSQMALTFYSRGWQQYTTFYAFGDAGGANTAYQEVEFLSMADNYATYVLVTINGGTPTVSGSGLYSYQVDSYALNASEATSIGEYLIGALSATRAVPNSISILLNTETSSRTFNAMGQNTGVTITMRGQTYTANVIGWTVSSNLDTTRVTLELAGTSQYNSLILNSTVYGTLDYNKLGF